MKKFTKNTLYPLAKNDVSRYDYMDMNSKTDPLKFEIVPFEEGFAYDITVVSDDASVGDYIRLLDAFLDAKIAPCLGCDLCCAQRIPLTLPDVYTYAGRERDAIAAFLREKAEIRFVGGAVDVKLAQKPDGKCVFLDGAEQRCLDHPRRSLVCHSYICVPQTKRARDLREALINGGEDALIGELFRLGVLDDGGRAADYPPDPRWRNRSFDEIPLKDVVPPAVYSALR
jgi:Fe-S-cluster containining protein